MLNVFVDIFAQSPVDYARATHVRVRVLDWAQAHTWLEVFLNRARQ